MIFYGSGWSYDKTDEARSFVQHSNMTFSMLGSSYLNVALTTVHHLYTVPCDDEAAMPNITIYKLSTLVMLSRANGSQTRGADNSRSLWSDGSSGSQSSCWCCLRQRCRRRDDSGRWHVILHQLEEVCIGCRHSAPAHFQCVGTGPHKLDSRWRWWLLGLQEPQVFETHLHRQTQTGTIKTALD